MSVKISIGPQPPEKIWVGLVEHQHGTNVYLGRTSAEVTGKILDFCIEWWHEEGIPGEPEGDADDIINRYFENAANDYVTHPCEHTV